MKTSDHTTTDPVWALTPTQRRGLNRIGDVMIPGDDRLPSFSASGAARNADGILPHLYDSDRDGLLLLLGTCAVLPKPGVRAIVAAAAWRSAPEPLAGALRMANTGIKGVVHALYWSDIDKQGIHATIGHDSKIVEEA